MLAGRITRTGAVVSTLLLATGSFGTRAQAQGNWLPYGTTGASEVAVSPSGAVWTIGKEPGSIRTLLKLGETTFASPPGTPLRAAVDLNGFAWVVNSNGDLWHWARTSAGKEDWVLSPQKALDVAVGANGAVWTIGTDQRIRRLRDDAWEAISGAGVRIAVDPTGNPWVVNSAGQIWKYSGTAWSLLDGHATDISIAPNGSAFILGTTAVPGGFEVMRLNGAIWEHILGGGGVAIAAGFHDLFVAQDVGSNRVLKNSYPTLAINYHPTTSATGTATAATGTAPATTGAITIATPIIPNIQPPTSQSTGTTAVSTGGPITITQSTFSIPVTPGVATPTSSTPTSSGTVTGGSLVLNGSPASGASDKPLVISGGPGARPNAQVPEAGVLLCPLIDNGERLRVGCALFGRPALTLGRAPSTSCTSPSFNDPRNGGECWTCPNSFIRNVSRIDATDACWKPVGETLAKATLTGSTGCSSSYFFDPRNGGECWQCPAGFGRTLEPVTAQKACSKGVFGPFSVASFGKKSGTCSGSSFGDPIDGGTCWTCPAGYRRTLNSVKSDGACAQTFDTQYSSATQVTGCSKLKGPPAYGTPFRDPRNGGECWVCPIPLVRSTAAVTNSNDGMLAACTSGGNTDRIVWQLGQYPEPGSYQFMQGLLSMALADPKAVDAFLGKRANGDPAVKRVLWQKMTADPGGSAELKALLFASLLTAAKQDNPNVVARDAVAGFESYMRLRRVYVAEEAVRMYNRWLDVDAYNMYQAARRSSGIGGISADVIGAAAADYKGYAWSAAVPDSAGIEFILASVALSRSGVSGGTGTVMNAGLSSFNLAYLEPVTKALEKGLDQLQETGATMLKTSNTLSKMASAATVLKGAEAGMIGATLLSGAIEISKGVMTLIEKDKQQAEYAGYVTEMNQPMRVRDLVTSVNPADQESLLLYWALATSPYKATNKINTGGMTGAELCASNSWTEQQCAIAKTMIATAAKAVGY